MKSDTRTDFEVDYGVTAEYIIDLLYMNERDIKEVFSGRCLSGPLVNNQILKQKIISSVILFPLILV